MVDYSSAIVGTNPTQTLLEFVADFLGVEADATLAAQINIAGAVVEQWLDKVIVAQPVQELYGGYFETVILHNTQVASLTSVTIDGEDRTSDYSLYNELGQTFLTRSTCRHDVPLDWRHFTRVVIDYVAGYDPLPLHLAQGLAYVAAGLYKTIGSGSAPGGSSGATKSLTLFNVGKVDYDTGSESASGGGAYFDGTPLITDAAASLFSRERRMSA